MHCPKCGIVMLEDEYICSNCGYLTDIAIAAHLIEPEPEAKTIPYYAGFWRRFSAFILDQFFLIMGVLIFLLIIGGAILMITVIGKKDIPFQMIRSFFGGFGIIIACLANWLYFTLMESSSRQATFGKMLMKIVVTDLNEKKITTGKANARYWSKFISTIPIFLGFVTMVFTSKKQAFHDKIAKTLVLNEYREE
jgi:uncharacterized RDD family membrane protein YckC